MATQTNTRGVDASSDDDVLNVVVLSGSARTDPTTTVLDDGTVRVAFDLVTGPGASSVPVTWTGKVSRAPRVTAGRSLAVVGRVRRHFYRANGSLVTRTDVLASGVAVTPGKRRSLIEGALAALQRWSP